MYTNRFSRIKTLVTAGAIALVAAAMTTSAHANAGFGSLQTTDILGNTNVNSYPSLLDVYASGGGSGAGNFLSAGCYAYAITTTNENSLVTTIGSLVKSTDAEASFFNVITGMSLNSAQIASGVTQINAPTPNGVYKLVVWQLGTDILNCPPVPSTLDGLSSFSKKSDNFTILATPTNEEVIPEPGTLALAGSMLLPLACVAVRRRRRTAA